MRAGHGNVRAAAAAKQDLMDDMRRGLRDSRSRRPAARAFIDDYLVEATGALTRTVQRARRLPRPLVESAILIEQQEDLAPCHP